MNDDDDKPKLNVISFRKPEESDTDRDINVDMVLEAAQGKLKSVVVAGWTDEGGFYLALSQGAIAENLMIVECAKALLVEYMIGGCRQMTDTIKLYRQERDIEYLAFNPRDTWRCDIRPDSGGDFHGVGATAPEALINAALEWQYYANVRAFQRGEE